MSEKLNIFDVLKKIDECDLEYFNNMSEVDKKSLHPLVLMRWMSGTKDNNQICRINAVANPFIFQLHREKDLLFKLLMCSTNSKKMYKWYANKKEPAKQLKNNIISEFYAISPKESQKYYDMFTINDLIVMAESLGYDKDQIKKLK